LGWYRCDYSCANNTKNISVAMKAFLDKLLEFLHSCDIIEDRKLNEMGFLLPEEGIVLINPDLIPNLDEYYLTILHEFAHWAFKELTDAEVEENIVRWYSNPKVRKVLEAELGVPEWLEEDGDE